MDVMTVNMPEVWEAAERVGMKKATHAERELVAKYNALDKAKSTCSQYVYAAHLPPGRHMFLIYCPVTKRLFCKDIFVDLSSPHFFPEYPKSFKRTSKPKTCSNVWRKWRDDSAIDITLALQDDCAHESFDPSLFLKNELDREFVLQIIE